MIDKTFEESLEEFPHILCDRVAANKYRIKKNITGFLKFLDKI